ncbi:MAG: hypothetical protein HY327_10545 [Chloroflexi bacterium]|nr:hypothetical protein [Chloroflexota bacterium]
MRFVFGFAGALLFVSCAAPAAIDTAAIQTTAAQTVIAQITAQAPTSPPAPSPIKGGESPAPPPGSPRSTPQFNPFANLTSAQRDCLIKELGDKNFQEISGFTRPPSRDEEPAMGKCLGFQPGVGQTPGAPPPGAQLPPGTGQTPAAPFGTPPAGAQPKAPGAGQPPGGAQQPSVFNDKTFFAASSDGLTWSEGALLAEKASVPDVMRSSKGILWAYWVDFSSATGANTEKIGVAKSADGKSWEKLGNAKFANLGSLVPVDPDVIELEDGRVRMYFYNIAVQQGEHPIHSAISTDGINFTVEAGTRFKAENIFDPDVVRLKDGRYRMFINNADKIISATSSDGLNFTADAGVRVAGGGSIPGSIVLADGSVRLYKCEKGITAYKSADGLTFTLEKESVIRGAGVLCDPSVAAMPTGFLMVYKVNTGQ